MFEFIQDFYYPYKIFYQNAFYSFLQNIESISTGLSQEAKGAIISALKIYPCFFIFTPVINIFACFSLHKKLGVLSIAVWSIPGLLGLCKFYSPELHIPDIYYMGGGLKYVGEVESTLHNVFLMCIFGWSVFTLITHAFKFKKFKDYYDHFWYLTGLTAIIIFVIDSNTTFYKDDINDNEAELTQNIDLTLRQLKFTRTECVKNYDELLAEGISPEFCKKIESVFNRYVFISEGKYFTRQYTDMDRLKSMVPDDILKDIEIFNKLQCITKKSTDCETVPFDLVRYDVSYDHFSKSALAVQALNKTSVQFWRDSIRLNAKIESSNKNPNIRWFFCMFLGFVVGGKISNASRSIMGAPKPVFRVWFTTSKKIISRVIFILKSTSISYWYKAKFIIKNLRAAKSSAEISVTEHAVMVKDFN